MKVATLVIALAMLIALTGIVMAEPVGPVVSGGSGYCNATQDVGGYILQCNVPYKTLNYPMEFSVASFKGTYSGKTGYFLETYPTKPAYDIRYKGSLYFDVACWYIVTPDGQVPMGGSKLAPLPDFSSA